MDLGLDRISLGNMRHPVRGFLHGGAAIASLLGGILLWARADGHPGRQLPLLAFAASLVALYTVSSVYHSFPWRQVWKARMQRVDHSMIYVLVAGTYTPIATLLLDSPMRALTLAMVWGIAAVGIAQKIAWPRVAAALSVSLQALQGWFGVVLIVPLARLLPAPAVLLLVAGGLLYTVGLISFVTQRPRLWPRIFSYHEVFHVCVVLGSLAHWLLIFHYVAAPLA
jgi:hemolysin III